MKVLLLKVFKTAQKLYFKGLLPWWIWSPIYDRLHRL